MSAAPRSVFISFAPGDRAAAERVHAALTGRGFATWMAPANLSVEDMHAAIVRAIGTSTDMVLVFSAAANASDDIRRELALAVQHRLTVVPVKVEDVAPNDHFAYELATSTWIDAAHDFDGAMNQLAAAVGASGVAAPPPAAAVAPVQAPPPAQAAPTAMSPPPTAQPQVVYMPYPNQAKPKSHVLRHVILTIIALVVLVVGGFGTWVYLYVWPMIQELQAKETECKTLKEADAIISACSAVIASKVGEKAGFAVGHTFRGKAYLMKKDYANALADFNWVIVNDEWIYLDYYYRSLAERGLGDTKAADADLATATSHGVRPTAADRAMEPVAATPAAPAPPTDTTTPPDQAPVAPDTATPEQPPADSASPDQSPPNQAPPEQAPPQDDSGSQTSGESRAHH